MLFSYETHSNTPPTKPDSREKIKQPINNDSRANYDFCLIRVTRQFMNHFNGKRRSLILKPLSGDTEKFRVRCFQQLVHRLPWAAIGEWLIRAAVLSCDCPPGETLFVGPNHQTDTNENQVSWCQHPSKGTAYALCQETHERSFRPAASSVAWACAMDW